MPDLQIGHRKIKTGGKAFVIAELGHNHGGDIDTALQMCKAAADCGVDAVKLQKRTMDKCYTKAFLQTPYNSEHAYGDTYGEHREALEFGLSEYEEIAALCSDLDVAFIATAFDEEAADFLVAVGVDAIKIASGDLTNTPLIEYCAKLGPPLIVSTGGGTEQDIKHADRAVGKCLAAFLHCVCIYPTPADKVNLTGIETLARWLPHRVIGYSCHYNGYAMGVPAYMYGAQILEKHFTLDHAAKGSDHALSLQPEGMRRMVRDLLRLIDARGTGAKRRHALEEKALSKMEKCLYPTRYLPSGHVLQEGDLVARSPALPGGLRPNRMSLAIGRPVIFDCSSSAPLLEADIWADHER